MWIQDLTTKLIALIVIIIIVTIVAFYIFNVFFDVAQLIPDEQWRALAKSAITVGISALLLLLSIPLMSRDSGWRR
ncbi:MAG: hypothetical protein QXK56_06495 [Sulfolobales archaeon]